MGNGRSPAWTVREFAESLMPGWEFPAEWLFWPPDVFSLTAMVMRQTGCYRQVLAAEWPREPGWQQRLEHSAQRWLAQVSSMLAQDEGAGQDPMATQEPGSVLLEALGTIVELAPTVTLEQLRVLPPGDTQRLARAIITMHCIADEACSGFGLLISPHPDHALAHCVANLLLTARGSLSSIPKHQGIVIPKMRTPQSGLTLRSFSHQLTFHTSEVEVMWRTVPWANIEENTINILAIPWPADIRERAFEPLPETFESVRYFRYAPPPSNDHARLDAVVELVQRVNNEVGRLHVLVFPELALTKAEYEALMWRLRTARRDNRIGHVPLIVTGLSNPDPAFGDLNEVRLAAYFAGRWYELSQRKHHRWKLDRNQIRQYALEGRFATTRNWYERIPLSQRRLTFLVPTGWLALCPLICEDLAQLEPVSDLIRGVGPTLLVALLMDGPQLKERWSARYASVFADDPGTAVLSLTCTGMACRSKPLHNPGGNEPARPTIALWKDQITGWSLLDLKNACDAVLLTISADWTEEWTIDGRGDHQNAAVFKFEGVRQYAFAEGSGREGTGNAKPTVPDDAPLSTDAAGGEKWLGDWADIRELSAATFALDAAISLQGKHIRKMMKWVLSAPDPRGTRGVPRRLVELLDLLRTSQQAPGDIGVEAQASVWPTRSLEWAATQIVDWFSEVPAADGSRATYWFTLMDGALTRLASGASPAKAKEKKLNEADRQRLTRAIPLAVLSALHSRVEQYRRKRPSMHGAVPPKPSFGTPTTWENMANLLDKIETALRQYS